MLSPTLLELLRDRYRIARPQGNFADYADHLHGDHAQIQRAPQKFGIIRVTA
jgi:hypothetical protein